MFNRSKLCQITTVLLRVYPNILYLTTDVHIVARKQNDNTAIPEGKYKSLSLVIYIPHRCYIDYMCSSQRKGGIFYVVLKI